MDWQAFDDPVAWFTGLLAVFTFLLFLATCLLAWVAWRQISDGRIAQRAYVAVEPLGIALMKEGDRVIGHIGIRNAGRLPARQLSWFINMKHSTRGDEQEFSLEEAKGKIIITPGTTATRGSDKHLKLQDLISASDRTEGRELSPEHPLFLYVWGVVHYNDGFRRAKRFTKFCHRYNWAVRDGPAKHEIAREHARYHEYGNDAD
jgi:hypothetical protein